MDKLLCLIICFFVGMLIFFLIRSYCGCIFVKGVHGRKIKYIPPHQLPYNTHSQLDENGCLIKYTENNNPYIPSSIAWNENGVVKYDNNNIVICKNIAEIQQIIKNNNNNKKINIRGGGHSYNNTSLKGTDNRNGTTIVFHENFSLDNKQKINIITNNKKVLLEVSADARLGELYAYAENNGYDIPGGTCPGVGVVGFTLGGGQGILLGHYGPLSHYLHKVKYINNKGEYKTSSEDIKVLRGGGTCKPYLITSIIFDITNLKSKKWIFSFIKVNLKNYIDTLSDENVTGLKGLFNFLNKNSNNPIFAPVNIYTDKIKNKRVFKQMTLCLIDQYNNNNNNIENLVLELNKIKGIEVYFYNKIVNSYYNIMRSELVCDASNYIFNENNWEAICNSKFVEGLISGHNEDNELIYENNSCSGGGAINTMWEEYEYKNKFGISAGTNPNEKIKYMVNRSWDSYDFDYIDVNEFSNINKAQNILNNFADFMGIDSYVNYPGPYSNTYNNVFPQDENFKGSFVQAYNKLDNDDSGEILSGVIPSCFKKNNNNKHYRFPNYPPTNMGNKNGGVNIELFFNNKNIELIKEYKKLNDPNNIFPSDYYY